MADIVSSLFGLTPREAEQQATQQNYELGALIGAASINPYDTAINQDAEIKRQAALAALGGQAVRGVAGLFGVQDERLKRATTIESILQSTQQELGDFVNNPAVLYPALQKKLADAGFSREAMQVGQVGQKAIQDYGVSQATRQAQEATAQEKMTQSKLNLAKTEVEKLSVLAIPQKASVLQKLRPELTLGQATAIASDPVAFRELIKEDPETTQVVETKEGQLLINKRSGATIKNLGASPDRASRTTTNINMGDKGRELILEKVDIPIVNKFAESAEATRGLARDSRVIANLLKGKEGGKVVQLSTKLAKDLGFENERITANDLANSLATRGAVNIRAVGSGSTSDLEFKAYLEAFPSLANSEQGREIIAKYAEKLAERQEKLADYGRKLVKEDRFSQEALAQYDNSLGSMLGDDFYVATRPQSPTVPKSRLSPQTQQYLNKRK